MDDKTTGASGKMYAVALSVLEELRGPSLAVAATGGPLLLRIKRLLAADGTGGSDGWASFTVSNLPGILFVLAFSAIILETTLVADQLEAEEMVSESKEKHSRKVLDIERTPRFHRLPGAFRDMLLAAGQSEWSPARINGVLGIAFSFEMRKGGGKVWQEANLDWDLTCKDKREFGLGYRIQRFHTQQGDEPGDISRVKAAAWEAVRASIDRGVPSVANCPMSSDPRSARDWGLLVGYDEADSTYIIRRHGGEFTVRHDAIGIATTDHCVLVYDGPEPVDANSLHVKALQKAVAFAKGPTYDPKDVYFRVDAFGFAAYELWREAIESGVTAAPEERSPSSGGHVEDSFYHSGQLRGLRAYAAAYLRELVDLFPAAASDLEKGAAHYDRVVEASDKIRTLCEEVFRASVLEGEKAKEKFAEDTRTEVIALITAALKAEREAIVSIEAALALVADSR